MARLNNGKLIDGNWHSGEEIMRSIPRGRRAVQVCGKTVKNLEPHRNYDPEVILKIRVMPDRSKGGFFQPRTTIDFDDINYDYRRNFGFQRLTGRITNLLIGFFSP
jgi:hypothetical protein